MKGKTLSESGISSFIPDFIKHVKQTDPGYPATAKNMDKATFEGHLLSFLQSQDGQNWRSSFKFNTNSTINWSTATSVPATIAWTFNYNHNQFDSSVGYIDAMKDMFDLVDKHKDKIDPGHGRVFALSDQYSNYVTIDVITSELFRNIILAVVCIFIVTLLLLTDFLASLYVLLSIVITLIDVAGFMNLWGLQIDTITALLLTVI